MAISIVGSSVGAGSTITIPAHQSGDLIVMYAHASIYNYQPVAPSASGNVPTWTLLSTSGAAGFSNHRTAYAFGTGSTTSGTWTNTDMLIVAVLRGVNATTPIGGRASGAVGSVAACTAPAVTMSVTDGSSVLLHFYGYGDTANLVGTISTEPAGYTRQVGTVLTTKLAGVLNTKTVTTSDGAVAQSTSSGASNSGATVEVLASGGVAVPTNQFFAMF